MCNKMIKGMGKLAYHMKTHAASAGAQAKKEKLAAHSAAGVDPSKLNTVEKRANLGPLQVLMLTLLLLFYLFSFVPAPYLQYSCFRVS